MALFKMQRGRGGARSMTQIATHEEGKNLLDKPDVESIDEPFVYKPEVEPKHLDAYAGSPAYQALLNGMNKQSVSWCQAFIDRIDSREELARLKPVEQNHPKHLGGRKGILVYLEKRDAELDPTKAVSEEQRPATGYPCDQCDFTAGSLEGLEAHITTIHEL